MFPNIVSDTSLLTAAARSAESSRPARLFDDPHAGILAGPEGEALLQEVGPDLAVPSIAIRTRYFDDVIRSAIGRGIEQVVLLGSGLDARAYRLGLPQSIRWLEVDWPQVLEYKRQRLAAASPTVSLRDVPGDVCDPELVPRLEAHGFQRDRAALWVAEGVFAFLPENEVGALLARLAHVSCKGSEILFDVTNVACLRAQGEFSRAGKSLHKRGFQFGTDDPAGLVSAHGFSVSVVHEGHPQAHYGRRAEPPVEQASSEKWTLYYVHGRRER